MKSSDDVLFPVYAPNDLSSFQPYTKTTTTSYSINVDPHQIAWGAYYAGFGLSIGILVGLCVSIAAVLLLTSIVEGVSNLGRRVLRGVA